jgi:hypothetical protein
MNSTVFGWVKWCKGRDKVLYLFGEPQPVWKPVRCPLRSLPSNKRVKLEIIDYGSLKTLFATLELMTLS